MVWCLAVTLAWYGVLDALNRPSTGTRRTLLTRGKGTFNDGPPATTTCLTYYTAPATPA